MIYLVKYMCMRVRVCVCVCVYIVCLNNDILISLFYTLLLVFNHVP